MPLLFFLIWPQACRKVLDETVLIEQTLGRLSQSLEDLDQSRFNSLIIRDRETVLITPEGAWTGWSSVDSVMQVFFGLGESYEILWKDLTVRLNSRGNTAGISARLAIVPIFTNPDSIHFRFCFSGLMEKKYNRWQIYQGHLSKQLGAD